MAHSLKLATLLTIAAALAAPSSATSQFIPWRPLWQPPLPFQPRPVPPAVPRPGPLSVGGFAALGLQGHDSPATSGLQEIALLGVYVESNRLPLNPGLDLRVARGFEVVRGTLVGPRVSASFGHFHPYAEALFGPNAITTQAADSSSQDVHGVTSELVLGLEGDLSEHIRWRVLEFTQGTFSGVSGSRPQEFSTGFVLRLP